MSPKSTNGGYRASAAAAGLLVLSFALWGTGSTGAGRPGTPDSKLARDLIGQGRCHCGCGRSLPGSPHEPACFGCSVGKAEIAYILESLAAGREPNDILLDLGQPVLVEVFADYTDSQLAQTWERARRAADELHQHRVVLRAPGRSERALRAVKLAECAREGGRFTRLQHALIDHTGPWDDATLLRLAGRADLSPDAVRGCLDDADVEAQLAKDRQHASLRRIQSYPAVSVDRELVPNTYDAIRAAIRRAMLEAST